MNVKKLKLILSKIKPMINDSLPIICELLLTPGKMRFTNLQCDIEWVCDNKATGTIEITHLMKVLTSLDPTDDINFESEQETSSIKVIVNGEQVALEASDNVDDFPKKLSTGKAFSTWLGKIDKEDISVFKEAVKFISNDDLRPAMTHLSFKDKIVTTDGYMLFFKKSKGYLDQIDFKVDFVPFNHDLKKTDLNDGDSIIVGQDKYTRLIYKKVNLMISQPIVNFLTTIVNDDINVYSHVNLTNEKLVNGESLADEIEVYAMLQAKGITITYRHLDCRFPDYENVIPKSYLNNLDEEAPRNETELILPKKEFTKWLKTAMNYANQTTHQIKLEIKEDSEIYINSEDLDYSREFKKKVSGAVFRYEFSPEFKNIEKIGFSGKNLMRAITHTKGDSFKLWITEPNRAGIIDDFILLMPVMLNDYYPV